MESSVHLRHCVNPCDFDIFVCGVRDQIFLISQYVLIIYVSIPWINTIKVALVRGGWFSLEGGCLGTAAAAGTVTLGVAQTLVIVSQTFVILSQTFVILSQTFVILSHV